MTTNSRIEKLERKLKLNQRVWDAPPLFSPTEEEFEEAHRKYPGATLIIIDIGLPSEYSCEIEE
jgi:hypothetical protein